ncbi:MAG: hypothetical protein GY795_34055 [Desulfobacterales bacterium]|nr:hypothetical protein [Desulfobacterales bacterium]
MKMKQLTIKWVSRDTPLSAVAVVTKNKAAVSLLSRLLSRASDIPSGLKGCCTDNYVVITGDEKDLPWVDGADYYGSDPDAPSMLLPTHSKPTVHAGLVEKAFSSRIKSGQNILIPEDRLIISLRKALPLDKETMQTWIKEHC